ncbi:MAG: methionyl-tRNA formyltransferase [Chloroflexi bacterium]|nr:methionyl-tRNA formyltransferase [Chloroflexota bacterium]
MRAVFMGTPSFVTPILEALNSDHQVDVVGVYTPPDRPRGRGRAPDMPPVKAYALELGLAVYQPVSLRSTRVQEELKELRPDVIVVAAYGKLLPSPVLQLPPHGCLNIHPSLLPKLRGPSPVASAILDGLTTTGVTLMLLDEGMDTGPVVTQREYPLSSLETSESLTPALFELGTGLLMDNLPDWAAGRLAPNPQDHAQATVTHKLERSHGLAHWTLPAEVLERQRRAYTPWPGLFTQWEGKVLKLLDVADLGSPTGTPTGAGNEPGLAVKLEEPGYPVGIATGRGVLGLRKVQLEGRRGVDAAEFLLGYPRFIGSRL